MVNTRVDGVGWKKRCWRAGAGLLLALAGCQSAPRGLPPPELKMFLGWERFQVLLEAERVESYRLTGEEDPTGIAGRRVLSRGPDLTPDQTAAVEALLVDPDSYVFQRFRRCDPAPSVALRHVREDETVDVLLSFDCNLWQFDFRGKTAIEEFDPVRPQLVDLVKELFPDDAELQALGASAE